MMKTTKIFLATMAIGFGAICTVSYNAKEATTELVGEPYAASFSYCEQFTGVGGNRRCLKYGIGQELRQDTINRGPLWDYEGYKIVR
jgi:hypothetical protein